MPKNSSDDPPPIISAFESAPDFDSLLTWTVNNIGKDPDSLLDDDVPNAACREMLRWARNEPDKFWPYVAKYDLKAKEKAEAERKFEDDKRRHFSLFDKLLEYWDKNSDADATTLVYPPTSLTRAT